MNAVRGAGAALARRAVWIAPLAITLALAAPMARAQVVTFDFDGGPQFGTTPLDQTSGGLTAHFTSSATGYSIQAANVLGFTPSGFSGLCLYPNSVFASDLLIAFSAPLTSASILYAPEEYATDSSCTMRITGLLGSTFVGTSTYQIDPPGTWPTGTLALTTATPFDHVVIHYDSPPPTGGDYGPIFMADNLVVTLASAPPPSAAPEPGTIALLLVAGLTGGASIVKRRWRSCACVRRNERAGT